MFISAITVSGFADLPSVDLNDLTRQVHLKGPTPSTTALGDALELVFACLSAERLVRLLRRWSLLQPDEEPDLLGEPFPAQAAWSDQKTARYLVADASRRNLSVTVTIVLDPPQFGELRDAATREPRLVTAISRGAALTLSVGALFANSFDAIALSLRACQIGDERFPTSAADRPPWLTKLLLGIGERFQRHQPGLSVPELAMEIATSWDHHSRYVSWQASLVDDLGAARVVRAPSGAPVLLVDDKPLRRWGTHGVEHVELAASAWLSGADVLWVESERDILDACVAGNQAPLEQIWRVSSKGDQEVCPAPGRRAARFERDEPAQ